MNSLLTPTMRSWFIYTLTDPQKPSVVRYVGVTHTTPGRRLARHLDNARKEAKFHSGKWVRSLRRKRAASHLGKTQSEATKAKISLAIKAVWAARKASGWTGWYTTDAKSEAP